MRAIYIFTFLFFINPTTTIGSNQKSFYTHDWSHSAGANDAQRYSHARQIGPGNVGDLELAFSHPLPIRNDYVIQASPIQSGDHLIVIVNESKIESVSPGNGKVQWTLKLDAPVSRRGMALADGLAFFSTSKGVYSVSVETGKILRLYPGGLSLVAPIIDNQSLYSVGVDGSITSYNIKSGEKEWGLNIKKECGTARVWSGASYSKSLSTIFVVTGNSDYSTLVNRSDCLANAVVAIDVKRKKISWIFQELSHDAWDLDMVGYPIVVDDYRIAIGKTSTVVFAFSKSGNIFMLNGRNGRALNNVTTHRMNGISIKKSSMNVSSLNVGPLNDKPLSDLDAAYLNDKRQHTSNVFSYSRPVAGVPSAHGGIHGGFEWPGGGYDPVSAYIVAPSNYYPWITRRESVYEIDQKLINLINASSAIKRNCTNCHGEKLDGIRSSEVHQSNAGRYVPSLLVKGIMDRRAMQSLIEFKKVHKYAGQEVAVFAENAAHGTNNSTWERLVQRLIEFSTPKPGSQTSGGAGSALKNTADRFTREVVKIDDKAFEVAKAELRNLHVHVEKTMVAKTEENFWQPLTDLSGLPITKPPWGYISAFDTQSAKLVWSVPFGYETHQGIRYDGSRNFGGALVTSSNLIFATGTVDKMLHIYNLRNGGLLRSLPIGTVGSAPPITYTYKGCQFVVVVASGGRFWYNKRGGDEAKMVAYKLKTCDVASK